LSCKNVIHNYLAGFWASYRLESGTWWLWRLKSWLRSTWEIHSRWKARLFLSAGLDQ